MPMPTMNELADIYGNWNPEASLQGMRQVDLAHQYEQGRIQEQGQDIRTKELGNIFAEQNNPKLLKKQDLEIAGLGYTNRKSAVDTRLAEGLEKYKLQAGQIEELKKMKQSDLDLADIEVKKMLRDPNPEVRKRGEQLWEFTDAVRAEKTKWDREMFKTREMEKGDTERTKMTTDATRYSADRSAQARENTKRLAIPKPPTTSSAAWVQALAAELAAGRITREQYLESIAAAVNADLAARALGKTDGISPKLTPEGQLELQNKPPAPTVQVPNATPTETPKTPARMPKLGEVRKGHSYIGGDPSEPSSWKKQ